jgi:hypothetical protein
VEIDSLESIPGLLKRLQIRALIFHACFPGKLWFSCMFKKKTGFLLNVRRETGKAELLTTVFGDTEYFFLFCQRFGGIMPVFFNF